MDDSLLSKLVGTKNRRTVWENFAILIVWAGLVMYQTSVHVMWRDEVRALSIALSGDDLIAMLRALHGEGHPALWYLLLRGAHTIFNNFAILPVVAFAVAATAVCLLIFLSPFSRLIVATLAGSHCFLYEYSVISRNYGISALLLFVIAALYRSWRDRGPLLGVLLLLLANTNVIAAMMVAAFLLFWFLELLEEESLQWSAKWKNFLLNASLATVGAALCAATMLPTVNDAAAVNWADVSPVSAAFKALINPGATTPGTLLGGAFPSPFVSAILFSLPLVLLPNRAAFASALAGLLLLSVFSGIGAVGSYRHALVWFVFFVSLLWISWEDISNSLRMRHEKQIKIFHYIGIFVFFFYAEFQFISGILAFERAITGKSLESRTKDLGALLRSSEKLSHAIVIPEPEFIVEALPYYASNPIYFVRENRFGKYVRFSRSGKLHSDLGEILTISKNLQKTRKLPVVIVITHKIKKLLPNAKYRESYNWSFSASEAQISNFRSSTKLIAEFGPVVSDESFDVYLLKDPGNNNP